MKFTKVHLPAFRSICVRCHSLIRSGNEDMYADLDGSPFVAYYCEQCKEELESQPDGGKS